MLDIERVLREDRLLRAFSGLNHKPFEELSHSFAIALEQLSAPAPRGPRQRAVGGGRKAHLSSPPTKLFFLLFYYKCYPTFDVAGVLFGVHRSRAHRWLLRWQPALETALGRKLALPERKLHSVEEFVGCFPQAKEVMIDGTERPIQRPQNSKERRSHYSGKKKRHTRKHLAAVDQDKRVLVLSQARAGTIHDKRLLDQEELALSIPDAIPIEVDLGFQGLQNEFVNIEIPHKKPRGSELSDEQKWKNQALSRRRVRCEHAFGGMKRYEAVSVVYRNHIEDLDDQFMLIAAGLWNFYLMAA